MWLSLCLHDASELQFLRNIIEDFVVSRVHFMFNFRNGGQFFCNYDVFTCTMPLNCICAALSKSAGHVISAALENRCLIHGGGQQQEEGRGFRYFQNFLVSFAVNCKIQVTKFKKGNSAH